MLVRAITRHTAWLSLVLSSQGASSRWRWTNRLGWQARMGARRCGICRILPRGGNTFAISSRSRQSGFALGAANTARKQARGRSGAPRRSGKSHLPERKASRSHRTDSLPPSRSGGPGRRSNLVAQVAICASPFPKDQSAFATSTRDMITSSRRWPRQACRPSATAL